MPTPAAGCGTALLKNRLGFATHAAVEHLPRLILEIPRGSERYRQLHAVRSAAERTNSTLEEDNAILRQPPIRSLRRAAVVVSLMGVITTLLVRVAGISIDVTVKQRKARASQDKHWFDQLSPPAVPSHLKPFAQPVVRAASERRETSEESRLRRRSQQGPAPSPAQHSLRVAPAFRPRAPEAKIAASI